MVVRNQLGLRVFREGSGLLGGNQEPCENWLCPRCSKPGVGIRILVQNSSQGVTARLSFYGIGPVE